MLEFFGLQKTTLVDYPGEVACTLFLGGCNWHCGYCFNVDLALNRSAQGHLTAGEVLSFLESRRGFLDGVCITGGEPLLHYPELGEFLRQAKTLGYKIKLDTNGSFPDRLQRVLDEKLADYVAMDIKAPLEKYEQIVGRPVEPHDLEESVRLIRRAAPDYEFRTTVFSNLTLEDFEKIGQWLRGSRRYFLQVGRTDMPLLDPDFAKTHRPPTLAELKKIAEHMRPYFEQVEIRAPASLKQP